MKAVEFKTDWMASSISDLILRYCPCKSTILIFRIAATIGYWRFSFASSRHEARLARWYSLFSSQVCGGLCPGWHRFFLHRRAGGGLFHREAAHPLLQ